MSQITLRRVVAIALSGAIFAAAIQPAAAAPIPTSRSLGEQTAFETVQYRGNRGYVRGKRRGGNGVAAAILGAVAIGAVAIAAGQERRRERRARAYYADPYAGQGYYHQPAPPVRYYQQEQQYYAPQYYAPQGYQPAPQYYQAPQRRAYRAAPQIDTASPYAVQRQQRAHRAAPQPYVGRQQPYHYQPGSGPYIQRDDYNNRTSN